MKRILVGIVVSIVALSWSLPAASQTGSGQVAASLDDQMFQAIEKGDFAMVLQLMDQGAHINAQGADGITALIAASAMGKTDVVKLLLERGAKTDVQNKRGDLRRP